MQLNERILTRAENLFLRYGIKSVSMDDLARELGISKKTLYQSVDNKRELLMQIFQNHVKNEMEAIEQIRAASNDAIEEMLRIANYVIPMLREISPTTFYDLKKYYGEVWRMIETFHQQQIYKEIKDNIEWGMKEGIYREDLNADIIAKLYVGKTMFIVDEDMFPLKNYEKENLFRTYIKYHIRGIASSKGLKLLEKHFKKLS